MPLCDTLLRAAEEPSFFRIAWSQQIIEEVQKGLQGPRFGYSAEQVGRRIRLMNAAFPEALHQVPQNLIHSIEGLLDPDDRHVVGWPFTLKPTQLLRPMFEIFPRKF